MGQRAKGVGHGAKGKGHGTEEFEGGIWKGELGMRNAEGTKTLKAKKSSKRKDEG